MLIGSGGLATSSTSVRKWSLGNRRMHHILDPRDGLPVRSRWRTASVAAASCAEANIASTAAIVLGDDAIRWLDQHQLPARLVDTHGGGAARRRLAAVTVGPSAYWYLTRASGAVALILLTLSVVVGVAAFGRVKTDRWPRFAIDGIHRTGSLLALAFLIVHIATAVLDSFAPIRLVDAVIPFAGSYRPLWLGLGAVALRSAAGGDRHQPGAGPARLPKLAGGALAGVSRAGRSRCVHGLGTGSDVRLGWMLAVNVLCTAVVLIAVVARVLIGWPGSPASAAGRARRRRRLRARAAGVGSRRPARAPLGPSRRDTTRAAGATSWKPGGFGMTPLRLLLGVERSASPLRAPHAAARAAAPTGQRRLADRRAGQRRRCGDEAAASSRSRESSMRSGAPRASRRW